MSTGYPIRHDERKSSSAQNLSPGQEIALQRLMLVQRVMFWMFVAAFVLVPGGLILLLLDSAAAGHALGLGWMVVFALLLGGLTVLPRLKCPRCSNRFFMANGWLGLPGTVNVANRKCVHCGLTEVKQRR
jgi:ribosomal protein S27AE